MILLIGTTSVAQSGNRIQPQSEMTGYGIPGYFIYSSWYYGLLNSAVNEEENNGTGQRLNPSFQRIPSSARLIEKYTESIRNTKISGYISIARYQIIRLEGPAIIHPFDYFW